MSDHLRNEVPLSHSPQFRHRYVICAIAKDEHRYIAEWIRFHLGIGFEHIYLYDNLSYIYIQDILQDTGLADKVTCMRWPDTPGESSQVHAYRHFAQSYGRDVEWAAVIDLDEFINLKQDRNIGLFLSRFPDAVAVALNWRIFGSSGHVQYEDKPVIERFVWASSPDFYRNKLRKTIHRMANTIAVDIHHGAYNAPDLIRTASGRQIFNNEIETEHVPEDYEVAQLNHYFTKSYGEWLDKLNRGYPDQTAHPVTLFSEFDRNEVYDASILERHPAE